MREFTQQRLWIVGVFTLVILSVMVSEWFSLFVAVYCLRMGKEFTMRMWLVDVKRDYMIVKKKREE